MSDNTFALREQHLYGSSRLGTLSLDRPMFNNINIDPSDTTTQATGAKQYELTNHLGNVLATITDKGIITSAQAYYPFGLTLASRSFTAGSSYRYSFNGKEDDKGLKQQDYGNRINRPDLGRFLSIDPLGKLYPELTPYQFASNSPMLYIDLEGLEAARKKIPHNVVIVIPSAKELEHPVKAGWHGAWFYIVKKDLAAVAKALEEYDGKIKNLIIDNHGGNTGGTIQYNSNGAAMAPNNIEKYPDNKNTEVKDAISALVVIGEKVQGGNCVVLACNFVKGEDGVVMFKKLHLLWDKKVNTYASDKFNQGTVVDQITNPISSVVTSDMKYERFYKLKAADSTVQAPYDIYFSRDVKKGIPNLIIKKSEEKKKN